MMQPENYKKRAGDVRRLARASLLEIRQARMARKTAIMRDHDAAPAFWKPDQSEPKPPSGMVEEGSNLDADTLSGGSLDALDELAVKNAALAEITDQTPTTNDETPDVAAVSLVSETAETVNIASDAVDPLTCDADGGSEPIKDDVAALIPGHEPDEETLDKAGHPQQISTDDWSRSELAQLPGAGPGLVWMLGQCNITTLSELAERDVAELSTQLGVVGQILDVGQWVSFAQESGQ